MIDNLSTKHSVIDRDPGTSAPLRLASCNHGAEARVCRCVVVRIVPPLHKHTPPGAAMVRRAGPCYSALGNVTRKHRVSMSVTASGTACALPSCPGLSL